MRYLLLLLAICCVATAQAKESDYLLLDADDFPMARGGAKKVLFLNERALEEDGKVNDAAEIWTDLRRELKDLGPTGVHVRVYVDGPRKPPAGIPKAIKTQLAELELFVAYVDWHFANDMTPWEKKRAELKR
jgi:hypothetical protein